MTSLEQKAITWYAQQHDAVPQLSARPIYYFRKRSDNSEISINIMALVPMFKKAREEEKRKAKEA